MSIILHMDKSGEYSPKEYPDTFLEYIQKKYENLHYYQDEVEIENELNKALSNYLEGSDKSYKYLEREFNKTLSMLKMQEQYWNQPIEKFHQKYLTALAAKYSGKGYHHHFDNDVRLNLVKKIYKATKELVEFYKNISRDTGKEKKIIHAHLLTSVSSRESDFHIIVAEVDRDFPYKNYNEKGSLKKTYDLLLESSSASSKLANEDYGIFTIMADGLEKIMRENGDEETPFRPIALKNYFYHEKVRIYAAIEEDTKRDFKGEYFESYRLALLKLKVIRKKNKELEGKRNYKHIDKALKEKEVSLNADKVTLRNELESQRKSRNEQFKIEGSVSNKSFLELNEGMSEYLSDLRTSLIDEHLILEITTLKFKRLFKQIEVGKIRKKIVWKDSMTSLKYFIIRLHPFLKNDIKSIWQATANTFLNKYQKSFEPKDISGTTDEFRDVNLKGRIDKVINSIPEKYKDLNKMEDDILQRKQDRKRRKDSI